MSLDELIALLQNRLAFNASQRVAAVQRGDVALVASLDADTATTQATLDALQAA
jgi:hypothetical protein